jgi:hypothetical protein
MYQGGFLNEANFTYCGMDDANGIAFESESNNTYVCYLVDSLPPNTFPFAPTETYAISDNAGGWTGYLNGTLVNGPFNNLGFTSGYADARAESYYEGNCEVTQSVQFGQGGWAWSDSTNSGSSWNTISSGTGADTGLYTVGSAPSPFTISAN